MSRELSSVEKRRVTQGGTWCEKCQVVHRMSKARWAVPGTCGDCQAYTTEVGLVSVKAKVDGKQSIGIVLVCSHCARRGFNVDLAELFNVDASRVEMLEARG